MAEQPTYKIRLLMACEGKNPEHDRRQPTGPDNPFSILNPKGTEQEGPAAWIHCLPDAVTGVVRAEPVDDVTRAKVEQELAKRSRIKAQQAEAEAQFAAKQAAKKASRRPKAPAPTEDQPSTSG